VRGSDLAEKLHAWLTLLDGSHFHRLMLAGGSFERLAEVEGAASSAFLWIFAAAFVGLSARCARAAQAGRLDRGELFVLLATLFVGAALLFTPRAARIHHVMNVQPFPQLVVALALARLWEARPRTLPAWGPRTLAAATLALALAGSLRIDLTVLDFLHETGGRGRWSGALAAFSRELPADTKVVSLDWGFHAPLRFLRPGLDLSEPVWSMAAAGAAGPGFALAGDADAVYLVQAPGYEVFQVGGALLTAVSRLPLGAAAVREYRDGGGETAFLSIRFARPHELVYRGTFEVKLR
jgi:hypothetical protein